MPGESAGASSNCGENASIKCPVLSLRHSAHFHFERETDGSFLGYATERPIWNVKYTVDGFNYEEAKKSIDNSWKGTHRTDGRDEVYKRLKSRLKEKIDNFKVIQRNIIEDDALREVEKISFANIDVDLYVFICFAYLFGSSK